jgi:hypothetical protein
MAFCSFVRYFYRNNYIKTENIGCIFQVVYITAQFRPQLCFNLNRKSTTQYLGLVGVLISSLFQSDNSDILNKIKKKQNVLHLEIF